MARTFTSRYSNHWLLYSHPGHFGALTRRLAKSNITVASAGAVYFDDLNAAFPFAKTRKQLKNGGGFYLELLMRSS